MTKAEFKTEWHRFSKISELPQGEDILIAGKDIMGNVDYIVAFVTLEDELIIPGTPFTLRKGRYEQTMYTLLYDPFMEVSP